MREYDYFFNRVPCGLWNFKDKESSLRYHVRYMLARTQSMFRYEGLPDTIPARIFELYLQVNGYAGVFKYKDDLYVCFGGLGGEPDYNYMPTIFTVSNPALNYSDNLRIGEECVIIRNDSLYTGLLPLFRKYGTALLENEVSLNLNTVNTRIPSLISASDDSVKESARVYLEHVYDGDLGVIGDKEFFENLKVQPYANTGANNQIKTLIEYHQYLKASEFNELGLDANYNMKRETLTDSENEMNRDALYPLIDDMLACREEGVKQINEMFGTNISVRFSSAWEDNAQELELQHELMREEIENVDEENDSEQADTEETDDEPDEEENEDETEKETE